MKLEILRRSVLAFLSTSRIDEHYKRMVKILLPAMKFDELNEINEALKTENEKMDVLGKKEKIAKLKYQIVSGKLKREGL